MSATAVEPATTPAPATQGTAPHYAYLTIARYAAALLVYFHHAGFVLQRPDVITSPHLRQLFSNGYVGVTFFFLLSGFVIALSSYDRLATPNAGATFGFYARRLARIVPVWLFLSLPIILVDARAHGVTPSVLQYLTFTQAWSGDYKVAFGFLSVAWTLSCEMFFYAMFPLLASTLARAERRWPAAPIVLVAVAVAVSLGAAAWFALDPARGALDVTDPGSSHRWLYHNPALRFAEFAAGVGLYRVFHRHADALRRARRTMISVLVLALLTVGTTMALLPAGPWGWTAAYVVPFGAVVLALAALEPATDLRRRLALAVLLGEASYAFYLVHQQFGLAIPTAAPPGLVALAWNLALVSALSVGLYMLIEKPARNFFYRRIDALSAGRITTSRT